MNFFEHQDQARRNTTLLIVLFGVAIASMILAFYIVTLIIIYYILFRAESSYLDPYAFSPWQPGLLLMVSAGTVGVVGITSLVKILQLQAGGKVIARSMGGQQVDIQTQDEDLRRLLNVVEEMAIASGVPGFDPIPLRQRPSTARSAAPAGRGFPRRASRYRPSRR